MSEQQVNCNTRDPSHKTLLRSAFKSLKGMASGYHARGAASVTCNAGSRSTSPQLRPASVPPQRNFGSATPFSIFLEAATTPHGPSLGYPWPTVQQQMQDLHSSTFAGAAEQQADTTTYLSADGFGPFAPPMQQTFDNNLQLPFLSASAVSPALPSTPMPAAPPPGCGPMRIKLLEHVAPKCDDK